MGIENMLDLTCEAGKDRESCCHLPLCLCHVLLEGTSSLTAALCRTSPGIPSRVEPRQGLEFCQAWCCPCFPGKPLLVRNNPLGEKPFPKTQLEPPLTQLQDIPLGPVTGHQREEFSAAAQLPLTRKL